MKIRKQNGPPEDLLYFDEDLNLSQKQVEDVIEIFNTVFPHHTSYVESLNITLLIYSVLMIKNIYNN